jgi:hypothetical protein
VLVLFLALGGCAGKDAQSDVHATGSLAATTTTAAESAAGTNDTDTTTLVNGKPHFASPEAAMRFLANAWNRRDTVNLKHVTDPGARDELDTMHGVATNLRLNHCEKNEPAGDYTCFFDHDYPPHASTTMAMQHDRPTGQAVFLVGPADTPGWYMTVFESCS